ncbi:MAG: LPS export ABC transporter ATP-binding protein [Defluviitoga tunisiensis]|jgi:lipopolysaccharide export system ATP-binding protein|uniref:ATP-binding cassette component of YhbG transport system n=1 Tax=Defluviitoga tunisiensis TaxID=1006576 RepID=A0A0C7NPX4_DEFTU|nr:LPS export ABC transporter ATP-binding protein [Defluviitoga tunisiensis]MDD3600295.1 LPS export ABC transporter ATP-binding protein [Defluviitoga tunisiensis]MDY0378899.1 LPS export ABC transporter ATP-binding protein [Defluviitoga tunisiensis]CEP77952.1 ATP-binding cassette component of YhbG transport system [Defluviitoga tunisiensis]HHV00728.1 LPS export ABC transporter ATP-binding protein [Defluviitoga tunisiensis]HOB54976.1 LPS export ABC transporter ATP-binding protein [Defluviitoga t
MENVIIDCKNIAKKYGKKKVLIDVNFQSKKGIVTGLLGPNGAGKSTLFKIILGLVVPNSGKIHLDGVDITHLPIHKRALSGLAYLPQEPSVFRNLTVIDNLQMISDLLKIDNADYKISSIIKEFGLDNLEHQYAYSLSGGEKRKLEFARTLLTNPKVILLDEPFVGIDPITVKDIQKIIRKLSETGISIIVTDHSVDEIVQVVDELYVIHKGTIIARGSPKNVLQDENVKANYLGW